MSLRGLVFVLFSVCASADPITALYLSGSINSVVGSQTTTITPTGGFQFSPTIGNQFFGATGPDYLQIMVTNDNASYRSVSDSQWWSLDLSVPVDQVLAPGLYTDAIDSPLLSDVGLSLYGNHQGDYGSNGYFDIVQIAYSGNQLISLAADFVLYDELNPQSINSGSIRFNSEIPLVTTSAVPEPTTLILVSCGLVAAMLVCLSKRKCALHIAPTFSVSRHEHRPGSKSCEMRRPTHQSGSSNLLQ